MLTLRKISRTQVSLLIQVCNTLTAANPQSRYPFVLSIGQGVSQTREGIVNSNEDDMLREMVACSGIIQHNSMFACRSVPLLMKLQLSLEGRHRSWNKERPWYFDA